MEKSLRVAEHTAPGMEEREDGSIQYLSLKNGPFHVKLVSDSLSMRSCPISVSLFYEDQEREVVTAKSAPLDFKTNISSDGKQATVECRIRVLSSAHEDSSFCVRFRLLDGSTGKPFDPDVVAFSAPVRIVSKPEQIIGKTASASAVGSAAEPPARAQKLRSEYVEQLEAIRNTARDQVAMLHGLVAAKEKELTDSGRQNEIIGDDEFLPPGYAPAAASAPAPKKAKKRAGRRKVIDDDEDEFEDEEEEPRPAARKKSKKALQEEQQQQQQPQPQQRDAFDGAFFRFLGSFSGLKPSAKAEQLRKAIQPLKPSKLALWENLLESAIPESSIKPGTFVQHEDNVDFCQCESCPYRARANNFDLMFAELDLPQ